MKFARTSAEQNTHGIFKLQQNLKKKIQATGNMESNNRNHQANNSVGSTKLEKEKMIPPKDFEILYKEHPLTEETTCGLGPIRSAWLQKFANKKAYVFIYGLLGCTFSASYAYFNGTITTIEKRFQIPSRTTGESYMLLLVEGIPLCL